jgi:PPK2 family polyphosphate:nucleotide phosphotransferase
VTSGGEAKRLRELTEVLRVEPGSKVDLVKDRDPAFTSGWLEKEEGVELLAEGTALLGEYQGRLAAQASHGLLVVLQGIDAAGKDGTIRHVMGGVNPQGVVVHSFKAPSAEERSHDFLWRHATRLPARGQIGIFNRSHYEEVLVVRVHPALLEGQGGPSAAPGPELWKRRYREINDWERYLVDNGLRIVKLLLNISREEQRVRFLQRIDRAEKNWKFSAADVHERAHWDAYQDAFSEMLTHTSTTWAPWHVIPADHKWFARLAVSAVLLRALGEIDPRYPKPTRADREALAQARAALEAEGRGPPAPERSHRAGGVRRFRPSESS